MDLLPSILPTAMIVAMLVAEPAMIRTNAAPGEIPLRINIAAIGVEQLEQMESGILINNAASSDRT